MRRNGCWALVALLLSASPAALAAEPESGDQARDEAPASDATASDDGDGEAAAEPGVEKAAADEAEPSAGPAGGDGKKGRVVEIAPPEPRWHGRKISLSLRDADLVEVLRSFAKLAEVNLIIDPRVSGKVTVELREVPWDQALVAILKTHGLGMEVSGGLWAVEPAGGGR